ncbi:type II toxin-antitoxin system RelE/ParE family toxin [Marinitoga sp. 1197]|uniref:type II toxin-antitoxin system RelE/ParE family toxin n=1 Tax=Marinitoga sp. 1197 TaxID=1428449 RepID=UPI00069BC0C4|nr:type II toxin-antitoxin system RelE/ParE family toxin [Marinitoga sp. 1197]
MENIEIKFDTKVEKYLRKLENSSKNEDIELLAEIFRTLELLKKLGTSLGSPYSKIIKGYKYKNISLRELRIKSHVQLRIFYFIKNNVIFILFDYNIKKTQKFGSTILDPIFRKMKRIINEMEEST